MPWKLSWRTIIAHQVIIASHRSNVCQAKTPTSER
uniref:Uncharacterized protein n=1 Tax=Arundo donax TaxID=35708 RepID=A0A0A8YGU0_ARUDO